MLSEDDDLMQNVDQIFVEPPDANVDTDEDSADEDEGGMIYNLKGKTNLSQFIFQLKKRKRGDYEHIIERNDGVLIVRWMDNSVVSMASTSVGVQPEGTVKRYCQKEKRHVMVPCPHCVAAYNQDMGGTDLMDQGIAAYRIGMRGKKWYWPIDVALHTSKL